MSRVEPYPMEAIISTLIGVTQRELKFSVYKYIN